MTAEIQRFDASSAPISFPSAERWASLIWLATTMTDDPRVLAAWARAAYVSPATLRMRCYAAGVPPKKSLDLARVLRALVRASQLGCLPADLLDARDPRTLRALWQAAKLPTGSQGANTLEEFLEAQRFVRAPLPLRALAVLLRQWTSSSGNAPALDRSQRRALAG
jgi:hypothetical protein